MNKFLFSSKSVLSYIVKNNPWYLVPLRVIYSSIILFYQYITRSTISVCLFNGKKLLLYPGNAVSSTFLYTDISDKKEITLLRSLANQNTIFLDIGAHIGSYSLCLSNKLNSTVVFEPSPEMAKRCKMNFILNNIPGDHVEQIALSSINGNVRFTTDKGETENHIVESNKNTIFVRSMTLDVYAKRKLSKKIHIY